MWAEIGLICLAGLFSLAAAFGGVVLGRRLERSERQKESAERRREDRKVAARLIIEELRRALAAMDHLVDTTSWWGPKGLETAWWDRHAGALAGLLADSEWRVVVAAYHEIAAAETARARRVLPSYALPDVARARERVRAAISVLEHHTVAVGDDGLSPGRLATLAAAEMAGQPAAPQEPPPLEEDAT